MGCNSLPGCISLPRNRLDTIETKNADRILIGNFYYHAIDRIRRLVGSRKRPLQLCLLVRPISGVRRSLYPNLPVDPCKRPQSVYRESYRSKQKRTADQPSARTHGKKRPSFKPRIFCLRIIISSTNIFPPPVRVT